MLISRSFQSFKDFVDYAYAYNVYTNALPCQTDSTLKWFQQFSGTATKEEAFSLCRDGFPEGKAAMQEVLDSLKEQISMSSEQFQFVPSIEGSAPDVQAFILGLPDDMLFMEPISIDAPPTILSIQMELFYSWQIDSNQVRLAGAVIFAAQEALKMQGCALQLTLSWTYKGYNGDKYQTYFTISPNLDLDTFSFIYTHPSMLRRIVWATCEREPVTIRKNFGFQIGGNYGRVSEHRIPSMDASLSFQSIAEQCNSMNDAKRVFNHLVFSKFNSQPATK